MTITREIEKKKNNKKTQKKNVFLFTPGVCVERNKKTTTTTTTTTTTIFWASVCVCVYIEILASFSEKNTFSSRAYFKFIDRKGKKNHKRNK
jgi:hypothetical protein